MEQDLNHRQRRARGDTTATNARCTRRANATGRSTNCHQSDEERQGARSRWSSSGDFQVRGSRSSEVLLPICLKPSGQQRQFRGTLKTLRSHTYSSAKVTGQITIIVGSRYLAISWENSGVLAESLQPESQCGYRTKRGTVDMTFAVKKLQEKCWEQH